jgi:hypothetical protein
MTTTVKKQSNIKASKFKFILGSIILIVSFLAPLLIPFVVQLKISSSLKAIISSLLIFGIPEAGMLIAVVILGKEGYTYLKSHLFFWLKSTTAISRTRHNIGITLFSLTLILGFLMPYVSYFFPSLLEKNLYLNFLILDILLFISLFVLSKNFWGKLKTLFIYDAIAPEKE